MNIAIVGFVRCGVGTAAAGAAIERLLAWSTDQNLMLAVQECYGYLTLLGLILMLLVLTSRYRTTFSALLPRLITVARTIRHPQPHKTKG